VKVKKPELEVVYPTDNAMEQKDIDKTPHMPDIGLKAYLKNYTGGTVNFQWNLRVQWVGPDGRKFDDLFPGNSTAQNSDASEWWVYWRNITRGGDNTTLDVTATADGKEYKKTINHPFKILGENPDPAVVKSGLTLAQKVIVYMESKWKQFKSDGFPLFGKPHGYGLMQLDNPIATPEQVWNWRANLQKGKDHFDKLFDLAGSYDSRIKEGKTKVYNNKTQKWEANDPDPHDINGDDDPWYYVDGGTKKPKKFNAQPMSTDQQLSEAFQRYNGGNYWKWIPDVEKEPMGTGKWKAYPPKPTEEGHEFSYGDEAYQLYCNPPADLK
jgi:hypothetical protein